MKNAETILKKWHDSLPTEEDEQGFIDNFYWPTRENQLRLVVTAMQEARKEALEKCVETLNSMRSEVEDIQKSRTAFHALLVVTSQMQAFDKAISRISALTTQEKKE